MLGLTTFELAGCCDGESDGDGCQTTIAATSGGGDYYAVDEVDRVLTAMFTELRMWRGLHVGTKLFPPISNAVAACDAIPALREALKP